MLVLDTSFFAVAGPAVVFAGISKGGFGSGAAFAAASILALVVEPGLALGVMLPMLMLIDLATLKPYWKKWSWPDAKLLILGGVPGDPVGWIANARLGRGRCRLCRRLHQLCQPRRRPPCGRLSA